MPTIELAVDVSEQGLEHPLGFDAEHLGRLEPVVRVRGVVRVLVGRERDPGRGECDGRRGSGHGQQRTAGWSAARA